MIVDFIYMALRKTNNIELNQNWRACRTVAGSDGGAASLFVYYGWAPDLQKELPRLENAFYTVQIRDQARHYEIVDGDITERLAAIQYESIINLNVRKIIENKRLSYEEKYNQLQKILKPRLWWKDGVGLGLTKEALEECNQRVRAYINALLDFGNVPLDEHINNVEIDKSNPGFLWAAPRKFIVTMEDLEFSDYKYNIDANMNRAKAAELGAARSRAAAERNFENVTGDEWTAQELYAQGIDKDKISRLVKNGLIEHTGRGRYRRISS